MQTSLSCTCGRSFPLKTNVNRPDFACPSCGKLIPVADSEQPSQSRRILAIVAVAVCVAGGLSLALLLQGNSPERRNDNEQASKKSVSIQTKQPAPSFAKKIVKPDAKTPPNSPKSKPDTPIEETKRNRVEEIALPVLIKPRVKIDPPKKNSPPTVLIDSIFPKEPKAGETLLIAIVGKDADGDEFRIEYREADEKAWTTAKDGLLKHGPLKPGKTELHIRAVDVRGAVSSVLVKRWMLEVLNRPPTITTIDVTPASDSKNDVLLVTLKAKDEDGDEIGFRYREADSKDWNPARGVTIRLPDLSDKQPMLLFQATDKRGGVSKVIQLPWAELVRRQWQKLKKGDKLFQHLVVAQNPKYRFNELNFASGFQYTILSRFIVKKRNADGGLVLQQTILGAKLNKADALSRPLLTGPVAAMPGTKFTVTLSPARQVTKFDGFDNQPIVAAQKFIFGEGIQMVSLLDQDGWKELIEASFFLPDRPLVPGVKWSNKMSHSWGPLGGWVGDRHYRYTNRKADRHEIRYALQLAYRPPDKQQGNIIPAQVADAKFTPQQAAGVIVFDQGKGRVLTVEEQFAVQGTLTMKILGQAAPVLIQETQRFQIHMLDRDPRKK